MNKSVPSAFVKLAEVLLRLSFSKTMIEQLPFMTDLRNMAVIINNSLNPLRRFRSVDLFDESSCKTFNRMECIELSNSS